MATIRIDDLENDIVLGDAVKMSVRTQDQNKFIFELAGCWFKLGFSRIQMAVKKFKATALEGTVSLDTILTYNNTFRSRIHPRWTKLPAFVRRMHAFVWVGTIRKGGRVI